MKNILGSASKIVLLIIALALVALTFLRIVDAKDFIVITSMVFTYYFTRNANQSNNA